MNFAREASQDQELAQQAVLPANQVIATIATANRSGKRLTSRDSSLVLASTNLPPANRRICDTNNACRWIVTVSPLPELRNTLEPLPGYFFVLDAQRRLLYSSFAVRLLPPPDQEDLNQYGIDLSPGGAAAKVPLPRDSVLGGRMLLVARSDTTLQPNISRVIAGLPTIDADVAPQLLLGTMLLLAPLMLLVSLGVAYFLAGNTFRPIDQLITEV